MNRGQVVGLLLWRGGLLLAAVAAVYQSVRFLLKFTDPELELGVALLIVGLLFVLMSLVAERVQDAHEEGNLLE